MTMDGKVACKKLMGRFTSRTWVRCGSCIYQIPGTMAWATT